MCVCMCVVSNVATIMTNQIPHLFNGECKEVTKYLKYDQYLRQINHYRIKYIIHSISIAFNYNREPR